MKSLAFCCITALFMPASVSAIWPVPEYKGDIKTRDTLTGDWGGDRSKWADKGLTFSVGSLSTYQSVINGGKNEADAFGGSLDYEVHMDFEKMGLWPGAYVRLYGETQYGDFINEDTGALLGANTDGLFPFVDEDETTLTGAIFYQFLNPRFGLFLGKIDTLDSDLNELAHGRGNDQFLNQNLVFNPVTLRTSPVSSYGGGVIALWPRATDTLTIVVQDPSAQPDEWDLGDAFDDGTLFSTELRLATNFLDKKGHQTFGGTYSTKNYTLLDQNPRLLLLSLLTNDTSNLAKEDDSWSLYYNFDQYLYTESNDPEQGIGIFGRLGIADEKTSPIDKFYSLGVGGKGIIPGRDKDTFGIGAYYVNVSDKLPNLVNNVTDGKGLEMFYNFEVTPSIHISPDFQIINPGIKSQDTAYVAGLRLKLDF